MVNIILISMIAGVSALILTPFIIKFSKKIGAVDIPNARSAHKEPMPTLGGLAIVISFAVGVLVLNPTSEYHLPILTGGIVIVITGILDDFFEFTARSKFLFQLVAASVVVFWGGLTIEFINLPFGGVLEFGWLGIVLSLLWIVGITNAINLIDGLDGLAAGISIIALFTTVVMAVFIGNVYVLTIGAILLFSIAGFLPYNFAPAKIFMGDTGALFLGYMIAVLALLGFKNVTLITVIVPFFILAVPILDTLVAIIRRMVQKQSISSPDSSHLHHRLIKIGLTSRQAVLFIYLLGAMFSLAAILLSMAPVWGIIVISAISLLVIQLLIETLEMIDNSFQPLTKLFKKIRPKKKRRKRE